MKKSRIHFMGIGGQGISAVAQMMVALDFYLGPVLEFAVPDAPLFGPVYRWYLGSVLPRIGRAVSRHDAAYGYLPASIDAFPAPEEFVKILRQQGFADATAGRLTFGSVILYTAHRPFDP